MYGRLVSPILLRQIPRALQSSRNFSSSVPQDVWKLGRLNHIAIATPDLPNSIALYRDIFKASVSAPEDLPDHGVTVVFIELDNTKIELLHPFGEKSPIAGFLKKNPNGGMHHICIEVNDIKSAMQDLKAQNIKLLSDEPKIGAHGKPVRDTYKKLFLPELTHIFISFSGSFYPSKKLSWCAS